jgi:hypothetical protein
MRHRISFHEVAIATFMLAAAVANAQPVTLTCGDTPENKTGRFFHFDESKRTAGWGTAQSTTVENPDVPATFSDTEITWKAYDSDFHRTTTVTLNRLTGVVRESIVPGGLGSSTYYCAVAQKAF